MELDSRFKKVTKWKMSTIVFQKLQETYEHVRAERNQIRFENRAQKNDSPVSGSLGRVVKI